MNRWLRAILSLLLVLLVLLVIDAGDVLTVLQRLPTWALLAALALSVPQVVLSAMRWRYTARKLGLPLGVSESILSYYRATLVNQLMPGGVLGDVERAWRARHPQARTSAAAHSVMIERLSGQLALLLTIGVLMAIAPPVSISLPGLSGKALWMGAGLVLLVILIRRVPAMRHYWARFRQDLRRALLDWPAPVVQVTLSAAVVATYFATLLVLDMALASQPITADKLALHACLLLSMVLPVSVAGWGVREGVAAVLWPLAGFPASEGVALGMAYGVVILLGSLPGFIPKPGPGLQRS